MGLFPKRSGMQTSLEKTQLDLLDSREVCWLSQDGQCQRHAISMQAGSSPPECGWGTGGLPPEAWVCRSSQGAGDLCSVPRRPAERVLAAWEPQWCHGGSRRASGRKKVIARSGPGCKVAEEMCVLSTWLGKSSTQGTNRLQLGTGATPSSCRPPRHPPLKMLEHHAYWKGESLKGNLFSSTE